MSNKCGSSGQDAINEANWCCNGNAGCRSSECAATSDSALNALPKCSISVTYDPAPLKPIEVNSRKSLIGVGPDAAFIGRGLRINGKSNIIIQNIAIKELNSKVRSFRRAYKSLQYSYSSFDLLQLIFGGDAITLVNSDLIWLDHISTQNIGRQHLVTGYAAARRVTVSNWDFNGATATSAQCNGRHYWNVLLVCLYSLVSKDLPTC